MMVDTSINKIPTGPRLDAAIARVLGWTHIVFQAYTPAGRHLCGADPSGKGGFYDNGIKMIPEWSNNNDAALELAAKIVNDDIGFRLTMGLKQKPHAEFWNRAQFYQAFGDTPAHAIVRAFLKFHGVIEVEDLDD